ncbi:hypothetical protein G6F64_012204 [Rhizopus arrhizus]|uniref:Alpha/beta hydrolase fold-3 domain-containing protein n=1 Tax=Rhizopus oryzae TaxID=64495 RepID=A0A9P6WXQ7_RHIOR|nr:hypothetical protein G6F64_012204 [Rhizopus arrhizus]
MLVTLANACIVFVHYSLSPEVKYPVALEECYAALCWTQQNAETIRVDTNKLTVLGDSSGGNLSTVLTMYAKEKGNDGIKQQVLYYPPLNTTFDSESFKLFKNDEFLPGAQVIYYVENYVRSKEDYLLPYIAPLRASLETLAGLPPALIMTAENDVLRSDGEEYAHKLLKAGVPALCVRYQNTAHSFLLPTRPQLSPEATAGITQTVVWLKSQWKEDLTLKV